MNSNSISTQNGNIQAELKIVYRQLVKQLHVDDIFNFKLSNIKKIGKKFPGLENIKFNIQFIDDDNEKVLIKSDKDLARAFVIASSRTFLRVMLTPIEGSADEESDNGSDFELVNHSEDEDINNGSDSDQSEEEGDGVVIISPPSEQADLLSTEINPKQTLVIDNSPKELTTETKGEDIISNISEEETLKETRQSFIFNETQSNGCSLTIDENNHQVNVDKSEETEKSSITLDEMKEEIPSSTLKESLPKSIKAILESCCVGNDASIQKLIEVLSSVLSDHLIVSELQQALGSEQVKDFIVDVFSAEKNGKNSLNAASAHLVPILNLISQVMQKHPQLFALVPIVAAFIMDFVNGKLTLSAEKEKKHQNSSVVHNHVFCDGCLKKNPDDKNYIVGPRYKSAVINDFDLCECCEEEGLYIESHGPFLKIYTPSQAPQSILCILNNDTRNRDTGFGKFAEKAVDEAPAASKFFIDVDENDAHELYDINIESLSSPVDPSKILLCPSKHRLNEFQVPVAGYRCDLCDAMANIGEQLLGCRKCDFDICFDCADKIEGPEICLMKLNCPGNHQLSHFLTYNPNFTCDNCYLKPGLQSIMYGCRTCNFDLCCKCYEKSTKKNMSAASHKESPNRQITPRLQSKFVEDGSFPDDSMVVSGETFIKSWTMKNTSKTGSWPQGSKLLPLGGETFGTPITGIPVNSLGPNEVTEISIELTAPTKLGKAIGYFRLSSPSGELFGERFWVSIVVNDVTVVESAKNSASTTTTIIEATNPPVSINVADNQASASVNAVTECGLSFADDFVAAGEIIQEPPKDHDILDKYSAELQALLDMGFDDLEKNIELIKRHDGNMDLILVEIFP